MNDNERFFQGIQCLSVDLRDKLFEIPDNLKNTIQEIRLRVNRPIAIVCPNITYYLTLNGGLISTYIENSMLISSKNDILDVFHNICNYSVYSKQDEICNGFVTMYGGHRAGICGTAIIENERIVNIRDISSINIRIAREHKGCAENIANKFNKMNGGVLICGPPCSGKTTVLRDLARILSEKNHKNVSLIDERGELAGTYLGVHQNDIGMCDVFDGYKKSVGMNQAVRAMAPDIIICDEIGSDDDIIALEHSIKCGVAIIATVHAINDYELKRKKNIDKLISIGAFENIIFLSGRQKPGEIQKIMKASDVFDI